MAGLLGRLAPLESVEGVLVMKAGTVLLILWIIFMWRIAVAVGAV